MISDVSFFSQKKDNFGAKLPFAADKAGSAQHTLVEPLAYGPQVPKPGSL